MDATESGVEYPMVRINQGRPGRSPYFKIILPVPGDDLHVGQVVECVNPRNNEMTKGIVTKHCWTWSWKEAPKAEILFIYGVNAELLHLVLKGADPAFETDWARFVMIREI
ncbi:MAG: hypothetical protein WCJ95_21635 [Mariniphaga sp.]